MENLEAKTNGNGNGSKGLIKQIRKRDGRIVPFDISYIEKAIQRAMSVSGEGNITNDPIRIAQSVKKDLEIQARESEKPETYTPDIEAIQNKVERELLVAGLFETGRGYITYRSERARIRSVNLTVPEDVRNLLAQDEQYFSNPLGRFVFMTKYARWQDDKGRREVWPETVQRYTNFMKQTLGSRLSEEDQSRVQNAILNQKVVPSMRLLWAAGSAAEKNNVTAFNCAYTAPNKLKDFGDIMYVLMSGSGVGFSVEDKVVQHLPIVRKQNGERLPVHVVEDSKEGWANALVHGLETWYGGRDVQFDYDKVRPAGARLMTMGGRSSGPEVLKQLLDYTRQRVLTKQGGRLDSLAVHDIICKTGEVVVAGGVRRSALISLSDLTDEKMRHAKFGDFYNREPQRQMANNSAVYNERPIANEFLREWLSLIESNSGERGIFNRGGLRDQLPERRLPWFESKLETSGVNPCGEIYLPSKGFCNLTEVIARPNSTMDQLLQQVEIASLMGTYQAMLTNFAYISPEWKENAEQERLLGVSITGMMDCPILRDPRNLQALKQRAVEVNGHYAAMWGINPAAAVTCVKPSGNTSQLVDASSGIHARDSPHYIRTVRINASDPLFHMLKDQKYPYSPENGQSAYSATTFVLPFAVEAPKGSIFKKDMDAIKQLEEWSRVKDNYTEHNPSVTVTVRDDEWLPVGNWIWNNWNRVGGLSFLPRDDHVYPQAPYQEITPQAYSKLSGSLPKIDYAQLIRYEKDDSTTGAKEAACVGGQCMIG